MTATYAFPAPVDLPQAEEKVVYLTTSGDLREPANVAGWATQEAFESVLAAALGNEGWSVRRAFDVDPGRGHGFVTSQRHGIETFRNIPPDAPVIVATTIWQYSHHVLPGLRTHRGPILTVANFAPDWPGLVGLLNLNASLTKARVPYSTTWTVDGKDEWFLACLRTWLETGTLEHDTSHVRDLPALPETEEVRLGRALAEQLRTEKAIMGVFDEGCMGMYNAIIDDELLNPLGIYKERLSQSELWAQMQTVPDDERVRWGSGSPTRA
ncbi:hypothetical protein [Georgenia sp. SUBG003]|uniref:hypothetical protein n=1 Tax=Georgenia sp. SUBG003 TaxID=1497974 RepID=UPI000A83A347